VKLAYKALKATRGVPGGRDAMRMMQKMGMKMDEIPDVSTVIIRTASKEIVIDEPSVTVINMQGQTMYQIAGGRISGAQPQPSVEAGLSDADVQLVAQQTGKSMEESRRALLEAGGDLAKAILALKGTSTSS
jgi:nascent polypeptide-associated complex subunit alpha